MAIADPDKFVLKPQLEGGGKINCYKSHLQVRNHMHCMISRSQSAARKMVNGKRQQKKQFQIIENVDRPSVVCLDHRGGQVNIPSQ